MRIRNRVTDMSWQLHGEQREVGHAHDPSVTAEVAGSLAGGPGANLGSVGVLGTVLDEPAGVASTEPGLELIPLRTRNSSSAHPQPMSSTVPCRSRVRNPTSSPARSSDSGASNVRSSYYCARVMVTNRASPTEPLRNNRIVGA